MLNQTDPCRPPVRRGYTGFTVGIRHFAVFAVLLYAVGSLTPRSFSQLAKGQRKLVGNVISSGFNIRPDFPNYWNAVTAENAGKWGSVQSSDTGVYNWTELGNIYDYAVSRGFRYRHHTLIWGAQQPVFMSNLDSAQQYQRIVSWFDASGQRYLSASFCDVVNEPLHQPPSYANALGGSGATGWDWVIRAFELARVYWPHTKLHLNDYGIINDGNATNRYLQIINLLRARGLIDGIGVQGHRFEIESASLSTLRNNLNSLAATGLPIYITEFDLGNLGNSGTPNDSVQLSLYQQRFPVLWEHPGVEGITLWGYVQGLTWQSTCYLVHTDGKERPALAWLRKYLQTPLPPGIVSPFGTSGEPRDANLVWNLSALATSYRVQVATNSTFSSFVVDSTVADTLLHLSPLAANTTFYWRVTASNDSGVSAYSVTANFTTGDQIVTVEELGGSPTDFKLFQNYPNPFNPTTTIRYIVGGVVAPGGAFLSAAEGREFSNVRLAVYDILGCEVAALVNERKPRGNHEVRFDATRLPSGVYVCRLTAGEYVASRKMVLTK